MKQYKCIPYDIYQIMKFLSSILFLAITFVSSSRKPICKNCKYFIKSELNDIYSKCSLYFENTYYLDEDKINYLVTGKKNTENTELYYYYCSIARESEQLCGIDGKYFKPKYPLKPLESREIIDM